MSRSTRDFLQRHIGRLAISPRDVDRRRGIASRVDLINDEVPFGVVTAVIRKRSRFYGNDLRVWRLASGDLPSNVGARWTRAEKYKYESGEGKHPSDE